MLRVWTPFVSKVVQQAAPAAILQVARLPLVNGQRQPDAGAL